MANEIGGVSGSFNPQADYIDSNVEAQRLAYARAMLYGNNQQPVKHWTQGVSNMVNALMGGNQLYNLDQRVKNARNTGLGANFDYQAQNAAGAGGAPPGPGPTQGAETPPQGQPQGQAQLSPQELGDQSPIAAGLNQAAPSGSSPEGPGMIPTSQAAATATALKGAPAGTNTLTGGAPGMQEYNIDPRFLPKRNIPSRLQYQQIMNTPGLSDMFKVPATMAVGQMGQPMSSPLGLGNLVWDPRNPGTQQWRANQEIKSIKGPGGIEVPAIMQAGSPAGDVLNVTGASGALGGFSNTVPSEGPPPNIAKSESAPTDSPTGESPAAGISTNEGPPVIRVPSASPQQTPPEAQTQATPPAAGGGNVMNQMMQMGLDYENRKARAEAEGKEFSKSQNQIQEASTKAAAVINDMSMMRAAMRDPRFITGGFAGLKVEGLRAMGGLGLADKDRIAPNDTFEKFAAGGTLAELQAQLANQGLGRILQTEVALLKGIIPQASNSPEANEKIVDFNMRVAKKAQLLSKVAQGFSRGYRIDPNTGDWAKDKNGKYVMAAPNSGSNEELKTNLTNWAIAPQNQAVTEKEINDWQKNYGTSAGTAPQEEGKSHKSRKWDTLFGTPPSATIEDAAKRRNMGIEKVPQ